MKDKGNVFVSPPSIAQVENGVTSHSAAAAEKGVLNFNYDRDRLKPS